MSRTESQRLAQQRYNDKAYDRLAILIKKGKREEYKRAAKIRGLGLAEMVRSSVEEYIENHPVEDNKLDELGNIPEK